ncbi:MAG: class I SAM-dependent methyltransferase [Nostoc sp. ChiSLP02]|nr:class I SAM-dependent methyltransferase [Nostoc sp. DedSLP05]MDZ8100804.1 class I SAM-dependent methyltransferase [Nostoc sp. DedSLP01]MDZ8188207.1 class I SAM-dependent methyltransferase [Nostoc sp. ChiSLP02]
MEQSIVAEQSPISQIKLLGKRLLFPGIDLHTRCRSHFLPKFFRSGEIETLDAGFGNGALSYAAYNLGNRVLGVTYDRTQVEKARTFFSALNTDPERLQFQVCNLYDLSQLNRKFDQIICSETLEHIQKDDAIVKYFYDILKPGGVLHLCCPFSLHPDHNLGRIDDPEDGGHVRDGYTLESYKKLLQPVGFQIVKSVGLGSPLLVALDKAMVAVRCKLGEIPAIPLFLLALPLQRLDYLNPSVPFSLYVQVVKPSHSNH